MDKAGVQAAFVSAGLSRLLKDLDRVARPSVRLHTDPVDEAALSVGSSKLGGTPDLPADISWPQWKGLPQSFIAQIRLADLQAYNTDNTLPRQGMLWFFYDAQQQTYGEDPKDAGGWRVFYKEDAATLRRTPFPAALPEQSRFHPCSVSFASEITLSQQPQLEIPVFDWTDAEQKQYEDLLARFPNPDDHAAIHHRMLGNPETLQDDMRQQCQLISQGVTDANDPRAAALTKGALDWLLLLQVDSDEHAGMQWGNTGMIYYWLKTADLQARRFDTAWLVLQSE